MEINTEESIYNQVKNISSKWKGEKVFIIGKGPTIDDFSIDDFRDGLILNINDSEKIIQGDIGVFSANWVRQSLKETGFGCSYYLAGKPLDKNTPHTLLPPVPFQFDDEELLLLRVARKEFYDESFSLINALKVCGLLGEMYDVVPEVYVLGFDFSTSKGELSQRIVVDYARDKAERGIMVHSHEHKFLQLLNYYKEVGQIKLLHVGNKEYSKLAPTDFKMKMRSVEVTTSKAIDTSVQADSDVLIVAELTNNHLGDLDRLMKMVEMAKDSGADLIKVQKRDVDSFYSKEKLESPYWSPFGKTLRDYRKGVELSAEMLYSLDEKCKYMGIGWFCSVLDYPSFEVIKNFHPSLIKIPSTISNHTDFHSQIAANYKGPIVISTGFTDQSYEEYVLDTFTENEKIYLLHCTSSYPTLLEDCNIAVVGHYHRLSQEHSNLVPGYSSHDVGSFASSLAVAHGAKMLEKHVKLGNVDWVHFDKVALDLDNDEFAHYVKDIRNAEIALGSPIKRKLSNEHHKYEVNHVRQ